MDADQKYYETSGHVITAGIALSILDIIVLTLRFWIRRNKNQGLKADDWLILLATISTVAIGISMVYGASQEALGYRTKIPSAFTGNSFDIMTDQLTMTSKIEFAFALLLPLTLGFVKASFLFFYMRIFVVDKKGLKNILLVGLIAFVSLWAIAFILATLFGCKLDVAAHWGSTHDLETKCVGSMQVVLVLCITDFLVDLVIICIPIPLVWRLNLSMRNKIAICAVFLLGSVTVAASLTRLIVEARAVAIGFAPGSDSVLVITEYIYWGFVECAAAILAACLPTLQALVTKDMNLQRSIHPRTLFKPRFNGWPQSLKRFRVDETPLVPMVPVRLRYTGSNDKGSGGVFYSGPSTALRSVRSEAPLISTETILPTQARVREGL
ncbi:hypothetical protein F5X99DRAFT_382350 [Biscogniauxia marginata]|nr:hypothetical protein F5X99DRAFT_382350 [Biscogniauxia marginata]